MGDGADDGGLGESGGPFQDQHEKREESALKRKNLKSNAPCARQRLTTTPLRAGVAGLGKCAGRKYMLVAALKREVC